MDEDLSKLDELILNGGLEIAGLTESGSFLYKFTDKLKDIDPELHSHMMSTMYDQIMFLWENGFITMDVTQENPTVSFTKKAFDPQSVNALPQLIYPSLLGTDQPLATDGDRRGGKGNEFKGSFRW